MNYHITYDADSACFLITTEGAFDIGAFERLAVDLLENPSWVPGTNCLFDYRETDFTSTARTDLQTASRLHKNNKDLVGSGKSALVMTDGTNFGMGRMYQGMTEPGVATRFKVFTDIAAAKDWIAEAA